MTRTSLYASAKRVLGLAGMLIAVGGPLVAWGGHKANSALATKVDTGTFQRFRDSSAAEKRFETQRHDYELDKIFGRLSRMDSTLQRIDRSHR